MNNFAKALLQIEQAVEKRFLRTPLSESQKTPERKKAKSKAAANGDHESENDDSSSNAHSNTKYQVLHNWEKSLMNCTTLSQVFIHLQTLDDSIAWSKSALNARCRLCKRKGDADKMLLCDKCDCGHHIYCLRPPLKVIPEGDWFCADCKPKSVEKTPRKIRKSFAAEMPESENEEDNDGEDEDDDDEEESDSISSVVNNKSKKTSQRGRKKVVEVEESESEEAENTDEEAEENDDAEEDEGEEADEVEDDEENENVEDEENEAEDEENDENGDNGMNEDEEEATPKATTKKNQHKIRLNGNHLNRNNVHTT